MTDATEFHMKQLLDSVAGMRQDFKGVSDLVLRHDERIDVLTRDQADLSRRLSESLEWLIKQEPVVKQITDTPEINKAHVAWSAGAGSALVVIAEFIRLVAFG
jgi:hypothetical protein